MRTKSLILAAGGALMLASASRAASFTTIYSDSFNRSGVLTGTSPDTTLGLYGGTAGATWTAGTTTLNGSTAYFTGSDLAYLSFIPQSGHKYTLTVLAQDLSDWAGIGFTKTATPSTTANLNDCESGSGAPAWILYQNNKANLEHVNTNAGTSAPGNTNNINTVTLVLDTTGAQWTETGLFNGTQYGTYTFTTNPTINTVALSAAYGGSGMYADSFSLTVDVPTSSVPEPASLSVLGLGGSLLLLRRKWR